MSHLEDVVTGSLGSCVPDPIRSLGNVTREVGPPGDGGSGDPPIGHTGSAGPGQCQAEAVSWPHVHGLQLHGLQLHFGLEQVAEAEASPQLQSTHVQGSHVQLGLVQVVDSAVVIAIFLTSR